MVYKFTPLKGSLWLAHLAISYFKNDSYNLFIRTYKKHPNVDGVFTNWVYFQPASSS